MTRLSTGLLGFLTALACSVPGQRTWRVPGDAPTIQDAVNRASAGDRILLVGTGSYRPGITIDKPLTIEPVPGKRAGVFLSRFDRHGLLVTGPLNGGRLLIRNFDVIPFEEPRLTVGYRDTLAVRLPVSDSGVVVLDSIKATGLVSNRDRAGPGAVISTGPRVRVMLRRCELAGARGDVPISQGEDGWAGSDGAILTLRGPSVLQQCRFVGGDGGDAWWWNTWCGRAKDGGGGLVLSSETCAVVDCVVRDGAGGTAYGTANCGRNPRDFCGSPGRSALGNDVYDARHQPAGTCGTRSPERRVGPGRQDLEVADTQHRAGQPLVVAARSLPIGQGWTGLLLGADLRALRAPAWRGVLYADVWFGFVAVAPRTSSSWVDVSLPAAPRSLSSDVDFALQLVHLDADRATLTIGSPITLTVFPASR